MKNKGYSKMVAIFAMVLAMAIPLWFALPATLVYAQEGGYGGAVVGQTFGETNPGVTSLIGGVDFVTGVMSRAATAQSPDKLLELTIDKGTIVRNNYGGALIGIVIVTMEDPPAPPPNTNVASPIYDLGPNGATFNPPITVTFTYDPDDIPEGVDEEDLVVAQSSSDWVVLEGSVVDPAANTITAPVSHFSAFTVLAPSAPAAFTVSGLTISPTEVKAGETVTISATVTNTGDLVGDYKAILEINGAVEAIKRITLDGPASQEVTFTTSKAAGIYTVGLGGLSGTFYVEGTLAPKPAPPAPKPAPPAPKPAPPAPKPAPLAPTPTPAPAPAPPAPPTAMAWPVIGAIIAGVIIIALIIWLVLRRRAIS